MSVSIDDLKQKNAQLKEELARLEQLDKSVHDEDSKENKQQRTAQSVKQAFEAFDRDHSGFIDKSELALLANELGETLDEEELSAALKAIDVSGDGKISFSEFFQWWMGADRKTSSKSLVKLVQLKAKLNAQYLMEVGRILVRQLSQVKVDGKESPKDWIKHRVEYSFGDIKEVKSSAVVAIAFDKVDSKLFSKDSPAVMVLTTQLKAGAKAEDIKALEDALSKDAVKDKLRVTFETDSKTNTHRTIVGLVGMGQDPFAITADLNLDLSKFVKELSFKLQFANRLGAFVGEGSEDKNLAELLAFRAEVLLQVRKEIFRTVATTMPMPGAVEGFWGAFLEQFNFSMDFGNLNEFIQAMKPPAGVEAPDFAQQVQQQMQMMAGGQMQLAAQMQGNPVLMFIQHAQQVIAVLTDPSSKGMIKGLLTGALSGMKKEDRVILETLQRAVEDVKSAKVHFQSGVTVALDMDHFLPISALPLSG